MRSQRTMLVLGALASAPSCRSDATQTTSEVRSQPAESGETRSQPAEFVSWREHIVDDRDLGRVPLAGGDGLAIADLDGDGHDDIVSVHESDTQYDGKPQGYIRVAFGSASPDTWELVTLGEGAEAAAAEDVAIGDLNGDGHPDVVVACELAHLIYFQNPGADARRARWQRIIPPPTTGRGSFIRIATADFDADGRPEIVAANKGAQNPDPQDKEPRPISVFAIEGDPLEGSSWKEHVLARVAVPQNVQTVDLDGDGDSDVVAGSRNEQRILWLENQGKLAFTEHRIEIDGTAAVTGFNFDFADLGGDGRVDIVLAESWSRLIWLEQPADTSKPWPLHAVGTIAPDHLAGLVLADIDGDGDRDAIVGGYSRGPRDADGDVTEKDPLGRLAWFENGGASWTRHDISRRKRGMFDEFVAVDLDRDGDVDFASTRGNSEPYDGVFWLEQVRTPQGAPPFVRARSEDSEEAAVPGD